MSPYAGGGSGGMAELPVGTILDWAGTFDATHKPDAGEWMECDGSTLSQTTYADLFALFGANRWGKDAGGNFAIPNLKRRVTVGHDVNGCTMSQVGGCLDGGGNWCCYWGAGGAENTYVYGSVQGLQSSGTYYLSPSSQAVSVLQPYVTVYKLLKVKKAA